MRLRLALATVVALALGGVSRAADFDGYAEAKTFAYARTHSEADSSSSAWGTLLLKGIERSGASVFTASVRLEGRSDEPTVYLFDPADREERRSALTLRELWVRTPLTPEIDLQFGRFELGWGKTDGYSPADAFLPRDLTDPFAEEKLPLWGARLTGQWSDTRGEAVVVPVTTPWRLPELGSRFAPLPFDPNNLADGGEEPPRDGFAAVRILESFGEWDAGVWARSGVTPAPVIHFLPVPGRIALRPHRIWVREHGAGIEISRIVESWVVRAEMGALRAEGDMVEDSVVWSVGAERAWDEYTLLVTLADNAGERGDVENIPYDRALLPVFISALTGQHAWGEWRATWMAGLRKGDGLAKAEFGYALTDEWKVWAGADYPYGPTSGALGALRDGRRIRGALRYSW